MTIQVVSLYGRYTDACTCSRELAYMHTLDDLTDDMTESTSMDMV